MDILSISILVFIILEISNVFILYFKTDSKLGNGVSVFDHFHESKKDPLLHEFVKYLVYWVAGTKLIFISLLIVILLFGNETLKIASLTVLILSILSFYYRLYPIIKNLDKNEKISPRGYSKILNLMIISFISMFSIALVISIK
ncbi:MAG: hypothetical protein R3Y64_00335 [Peptostreptococcaceae bacterium]